MANEDDTPPYITLTNMIANIDTSIDNFVEQLSQRNPLKEISVNESGGKPSASASAAATKFTRVDGDFPKLTVPLFEQMVYHRAGSMNLNPLSIFIPTGYKINFQEINEYFKEMARRNDPETQELMNLVIAAYGNNNNSLFFKHTLPGKPTAAGARPVMVSGIRPVPTTTTKGVFDLDPKTAEFIQFKIDKWHRSYIDWCFYRNATRFFVENQQLPKDELVTLKMEFDEVYDTTSGGKGLMKMVSLINEDYKNIQKHYDFNVNRDLKIQKNSNDFQTFIYLFDILYAEIQKYKDDPLDYVTERKKYFPSYSFDANSLSLLLQVFDKFRSIFLQLKLLEDAAAHNAKNFIDTVPYLSQLETLQSISDEFMRLKQSIETDPALKTAVEIFEKYMLTSNGFVDVNRQTKHIPSYKIIQYVFQTIGYYNEPRATPPLLPPPSGLFERYVAKLYTGGGATKPKDPREIFNKLIDDEFIEKLFNESRISSSHPYKAKMDELNKFINSHFDLIELLTKRKGLNKTEQSDDDGSPVRNTLAKNRKAAKAAAAAPPPAFIFQSGELENKRKLTNKIKALNIDLQAYVTTADADADEVYTNNDSLDNKIKQVEAKIKLLKGKYFVSSLLFYNHYFITTPPSPVPASNVITAAAADFFQKFYTESKLDTPELDSFPQKNAVTSFTFGIDLIFLLLFRVSKYYFASFHANFIEKLKEQIGPQNVKLRSLRENVQYKESKLNHVCEIVAKLLGISVVRIIPDRSSYLIKADGEFKGFVDLSAGSGYLKKWEDNIADSSGKYSAKIKYVTDKMTKGLDKALGFAEDDDEKNKKMKETALIELLEHNTVQVVHMLFAKPRDLWYSPDMRAGSLTSVSKWVFFRLEKPEIVTKSAFKWLKGHWDDPINIGRLSVILGKIPKIRKNEFDIKVVTDDSFNDNTLASGENALCALVIASQPSPQMIEPSKDSANDPRFQNPSFSVGDIIPTINDDHAVGSKLIQKLKDAIKPDPEKCSNVRGLIQEQADEIKMMTMNAIRSGGVDMSIEIDELMIKRYRSMIDESVTSANAANTKAQYAISGIDNWKDAASEAAEAANDVNVLVRITKKSKTQVDAAAAAASAAAVAAKAAAVAAKAAAALAAADPTTSVSSLKKITETAKEHEIEAIKKLKETIKHADDSKSFAIVATYSGIMALKDFSYKTIDENVTGYKNELYRFKAKIRMLETNATDLAISKEILKVKTEIERLSGLIYDDSKFCNGEYDKFVGFIASLTPPKSPTNVNLLPIIRDAKQAKEDIRLRVKNILTKYPPQPTVPNIETKIAEIESLIKEVASAAAAAVAAAAMLVNNQKATDILTAIQAEIKKTNIIRNYNSISANVTDQFVTDVNPFLKDKLLNIGNISYNSLTSVPWFKATLANMVKIAKLNKAFKDPIPNINVVFNTVVVALHEITQLIIHTISYSSGVFDDSIKPRIDGLLTTPNLTHAVITKFQDVLRECQRIYDDDLSIDDFVTQKNTLDQMIKSITSSIASGTFAYDDETTVVKQINDVNASIDEFKRKFPYLQLLLDISTRVLGGNLDPDSLLEFIIAEKLRISGVPAPPLPAPAPPAPPAPPAHPVPAPAPAVPVAVAVTASAIIAATNPQQTIIDEIKTILGDIETTLNPLPLPRLPPPVINIKYDALTASAVGMKDETSRIVTTQLGQIKQILDEKAQAARDLIDKITESIIKPINEVSGAGVSGAGVSNTAVSVLLEDINDTLHTTISKFDDLIAEIVNHSTNYTNPIRTHIGNIQDIKIDVAKLKELRIIVQPYIKRYNELLQSHTVYMNKTQQDAIKLANEYLKFRGDVKPDEPLSDFQPNQVLIREIEGLLESVS
jgi:hypothetical protein